MTTEKITINAGATFSTTVFPETGTEVFKAITAITKAAPAAITAVAHGLKTGWRVAVESVVGMTQINARSTPAADYDYHKVTVSSVDVITLDGVNSLGYSAYTSGGTLRYFAPMSLAGATARMDFVDKWRALSAGISRPHKVSTAYAVGDITHKSATPGTHYTCTVAGTSAASEPANLTAGDGTVTWVANPTFAGTTVYLSLANGSGITIDDTNHTITWTLTDTQTSEVASVWTTALAQLEVVVGGVVTRLNDYVVTLSPETTR